MRDRANQPPGVRRALLVTAAFLYPATLAGAWAALRWVGEQWWVTCIALYVPRIAFGVPLPFVVAGLVATRMRRFLWTQGLALVLLVFGLMGFTLPHPRASSARAPTMRVLSYNVNSGFGGYDKIVAEVDRYSPDIAAMMEVSDSPTLVALLKTRYPSVIASTQFVLATRYPVVSSHDPDRVPYYGRSRTARYVQHVIDTPVGRIAFYVVHPLSPREDFNAVRGGAGLKKEILSGHLFAWPAALITQANAGLRALQVDSFAEAAAGETIPVIIAGDTNLPDPSFVLHRYLSGYRDGFREAGAGFGYTFPTNKLLPWMRIDRILASQSLRFTAFQVGTSLASDHLCIVADIAHGP